MNEIDWVVWMEEEEQSGRKIRQMRPKIDPQKVVSGTAR